MNKVSPEFLKQVAGYGLTTSWITYRMPDHRRILQEFLWQDYDIYPQFPILVKFLTFWGEKLDGPIFSVKVAHQRLIKPAELKVLDGDFRLN